MSRLRTTVGGVVLALTATACSAGGSDDAVADLPDAAASRAAQHGAGHGAGATAAPAAAPLRKDERLLRLTMDEPYEPSAPYGKGSDDYRCFVLDPELDEDAFITGLNILPGSPEVVHHVILFRVPLESVGTVEEQDEAGRGPGWTCFGGTGGESPGADLEDAPWLGAWAPGGREQLLADDVGVPLAKGSRVIMQVHYNLAAGPHADVSSAQLRLAPGTSDLAALETMLLPAPVELPCRPGRDEGELCDRDKAVDDAQERFGADIGLAANFLHMLCGPLRPGPVQTCDRTVDRPATIRAAAGHMHLLGRSIRVEVNPGTPRERTVLDVPVWNFDDQAATEVDSVRLRRGDTVRVTCRHDQTLRDLLPAFEGQDERYVVWGEGTTDEMCLGLLMVTRD